MSIEPGCLYVVATPIGNRGDLSPRAQQVLAAVAVVAAEDTRHTGRLLKDLGIRAELVSLHEHNERGRIPALIERVRGGDDVAVVTDAGTPGISDPGYPLVLAAHEAGVTVRAVPGPSAVAAALSVAGQPTDRFAFEGFLPSKARARRTRLRQLAADPRTQVIFEAGRRLEAALADCAACFGADRPATLAREMTKQFETVMRASLTDLRAAVAADSNQQRGECVLVIAGASERGMSETAEVSLDQALDALLAEVAPPRAAAIAARLTGVARREAYERALTRRPDRSS